MRIFLAGTSADPVYGGPAYSVTGLAGAMAAAGVEVGFWAPDGSSVTTPLLSRDSGVQRFDGSASEALGRFGRVDVLHDNGLWRPHNHRLAVLAAARRLPRIVSLRGMLEPWAINHKKIRKRIAWHAYQRRDLVRAACHHATSEQEAEHLRRIGLRVPVRMIPNGIDLPVSDGRAAAAGRPDASRGPTTALFLGRLYPVKGLPLLIEAWNRVRPAGWSLLIAGPDEAGHRAEVQRAIDAAGLNDVISFAGALDGTAKHAALSRADLLILPSLSESFGMVVLEALAHAVPVLTTVRAPWPMLASRGCGWSVEPTVEGLTDGLRRATALPLAQLRTMGARGRDLVAFRFEWRQVVAEFLALYEEVGGRARTAVA